jgi:carboxylesterase
VVELAYDLTPLAALASLGAAIDDLQARLASITCPTLVMSSPEDHVVPPPDSDHLATTVSGPVERVTLARSFHVATLDHDAPLIEREAVAFATKVRGDRAATGPGIS